MIQIRNGVFETNSSSSHSIAIKKVDERLTPEEIAKEFEYVVSDTGRYYLTESELEFERSPFAILISFRDKLNFAIASLGKRESYRNEIERIMYAYIPGLRKIVYPRDQNYDEEDVDYYGYIDHQSQGLLENFLTKHNLSIEEFLINKKYIVFIDGDEYQITETLFESGLMHEDDFEERYDIYSDEEED